MTFKTLILMILSYATGVLFGHVFWGYRNKEDRCHDKAAYICGGIDLKEKNARVQEYYNDCVGE